MKQVQAPFLSGGSEVVDEAMAMRLLDVAMQRGGDFADLFFEYARSASFGFEEGILRSAGKAVDMGLGVRVQVDDATGYAYVEEFAPEAMIHAARTASAIANAPGKSAAPTRIQHPALPSRYPIERPASEVLGAEKRALLVRADKAARGMSPKVQRVEVSLSEEVRSLLIVSTTGIWAEDTQPLLRFGVRVVVEDKGQRQSGSSGGGGRIGLEYFDGKTPEWHAEEAVRQALVMLEAREAPAGEFPVVLAPGDSGILLHEAVGHGLEADFNRKRTSNYTDQVGEKVASALCTVVDDASLQGDRGSINVDDEGNAPGRTVLIEDGILRGYMQDRHSARHFGVEENGHGRRADFRAAPLPRMTNTFLSAGKDDPEDIIRSVKRGVYASKFGGGQVDISNGDFVFSLTEGYLIEDGKITAPLKGVNLIGNGPEVMRRVTMLGHDFASSDGIWTCGKDGQSVPVGVGCPTIKIEAMTVGGTDLG